MLRESSSCSTSLDDGILSKWGDEVWRELGLIATERGTLKAFLLSCFPVMQTVKVFSLVTKNKAQHHVNFSIDMVSSQSSSDMLRKAMSEMHEAKHKNAIATTTSNIDKLKPMSQVSVVSGVNCATEWFLDFFFFSKWNKPLDCGWLTLSVIMLLLVCPFI